MVYLAMKTVTSGVLALCCLGTVLGTSMPFFEVPDFSRVYRLLNVQCIPMPPRSPYHHYDFLPELRHPGLGHLPGHGHLPGYYESLSATHDTCHLWVDASGSCRVDWTHVITEAYCRQVIGDVIYRSLSRDHPSRPAPHGQGEGLPCGSSTSPTPTPSLSV